MKGALQQSVLLSMIWRIHFIYAPSSSTSSITLTTPLLNNTPSQLIETPSRLIGTTSKQNVRDASKIDDCTPLQIHEHSNRFNLYFTTKFYESLVNREVPTETHHSGSKEFNLPSDELRLVEYVAIATVLSRNSVSTLRFKWSHLDQPCVSNNSESTGLGWFDSVQTFLPVEGNDKPYKIDTPYFVFKKFIATISVSGSDEVATNGSFNYTHLDIMVPKVSFKRFETIIRGEITVMDTSMKYLHFECDEKRVGSFPTLKFTRFDDKSNYFLTYYDYVLRNPANGLCFAAILPSEKNTSSIGGIFFRKYVTDIKMDINGKFRFGFKLAEEPKTNFPINYQLGHGTADNREN